MAYKRTSKKFGNIRNTKTINTNGNITNSTSTGSKGNRTTTSWSSKGGMKTTQTFKDGAGYVHTKTLYKSPTAAQRAREAKKNQQFWNSVFGVKKTRRSKKSSEPTALDKIIGWGVIAFIGMLLITWIK